MSETLLEAMWKCLYFQHIRLHEQTADQVIKNAEKLRELKFKPISETACLLKIKNCYKLLIRPTNSLDILESKSFAEPLF